MAAPGVAMARRGGPWGGRAVAVWARYLGSPFGADDSFREWVQAERLQVEALYAVLYLLGYYLVFVHKQLGSPPAGRGELPLFLGGGSAWVKALRLAMVALHGFPLAAALCANARWGAWRDAYVSRLRGPVFILIRLLPVCMALHDGRLLACAEAGSEAEVCRPPLMSWMWTFLLWIGAYQVARGWQIALQVLSTLCLWTMTDYSWTAALGVKLLLCGVAMPIICAWLLESVAIWERNETNWRIRRHTAAETIGASDRRPHVE